MRGPVFFAYADNCLVDVHSAIIADVEASRAARVAGFVNYQMTTTCAAQLVVYYH
jgi:hypothetical protein